MQSTLFPETNAALSVPGLSYVEDYITRDEEAALLAWIHAQEWSDALARKVQHYGYYYDYKSRAVSPANYIGKLPQPLLALAITLQEKGHMAQCANQVIINAYVPGQGIAAHIDQPNNFGPEIVSLSLGTAVEMAFTPPPGTKTPAQSLYLQPRSIVRLADEARYRWQHGIAARKSDKIGGTRLARGERISVTFRRVV